MKRFHDLTNEEILSIAEDKDLTLRLIDLECAYQGLPIAPKEPGPKPEKTDFPKDATYFEVGTFKFGSASDAAKVMDLLTTLQLYDTSYCNGDYILKPIYSDNYYYPKVEKGTCYTQKTYDKIKDELASMKQRNEEWEEANSEYNKALEARRGVTEKFWDTVHFLRSVNNAIENIQSDYAKYLDLAEGIKEVALNFLLHAHKEKKDLVEDAGVVYYVDEYGNKHEVSLDK